MERDHTEIDRKLGQITEWQKNHEDKDEVTRKLVESLPTKTETEEIVRRVFLEAIVGAGKWSKMAIVTIAVVVGSIGVISGGFKWLLAVIGFTQIK